MDKEWNNLEKFEEHFFNRMKVMAEYIPSGASVLDMGCGPMWLKRILSPDSIYYPVDYIARGKDTIVCDFNKHEFPDNHADIIFCSGVIEYVVDYKWFIKEIAAHGKKCIVSYNPVEYTPDQKMRESLNWVNSLSRAELISCFESAGFSFLEERVISDLSGVDEFIGVFEK